MSRPADASETATRALKLQELPALYRVRAEARWALGEYDRALSDVNIVLFHDANLAEARALRSQLLLQRENRD